MARLMSCRTRFNDPDEVLGAAGLLPHPATHIITLQQSMCIYTVLAGVISEATLMAIYTQFSLISHRV